MKKIVCIILVLMMLLFPILLFADEIDDELIEVGPIWEEAVQTVASTYDEPILNSKAAVVYDRDSKTILYNKNMDEKRAMASTTNVISYQR